MPTPSHYMYMFRPASARASCARRLTSSGAHWPPHAAQPAGAVCEPRGARALCSKPTEAHAAKGTLSLLGRYRAASRAMPLTVAFATCLVKGSASDAVAQVRAVIPQFPCGLRALPVPARAHPPPSLHARRPALPASARPACSAATASDSDEVIRVHLRLSWRAGTGVS